MRFRPIEQKSGLFRPELIPLVGLAFQLLTFFIIVINLETTRADERVKLPRDMIARPPEVKPEHELLLRLGYQRDASGARVDSLPLVFFDERGFEIAQIGPELVRERRLIEQSEGRLAVKDVTVLIRGDANLPAGLVQELIKKCQEAGFSKFTLRTSSEVSR